MSLPTLNSVTSRESELMLEAEAFRAALAEAERRAAVLSRLASALIAAGPLGEPTGGRVSPEHALTRIAAIIDSEGLSGEALVEALTAEVRAAGR